MVSNEKLKSQIQAALAELGIDGFEIADSNAGMRDQLKELNEAIEKRDESEAAEEAAEQAAAQAEMMAGEAQSEMAEAVAASAGSDVKGDDVKREDVRYVVAPGRSICCGPQGVLGPGEQVIPGSYIDIKPLLAAGIILEQ